MQTKTQNIPVIGTASPVAHSPLPWRRIVVETENRMGYDSFVVSANGEDDWVARIVGRGNPESNAALIVRAVNNHDALVTALREVAKWKKRTGNYPPALAGVEAVLSAATL